MENQELIENTKLITNFSQTKDYYNAYKIPLNSDTEISRATLFILHNSDPEKETAKHEVDRRGMALKILERIKVEHSQQYNFLHRIILYDDTPNIILAIKCISTFCARRNLPQEDYLKFLETVCKKIILYIKEFCTGNLNNSIQFMNMFAFVSDLAKACNVFNDSVNDLIIEMEKCSSFLMQMEIKEPIRRNQVNYNLFKFLNFIYEVNSIYKKDDFIFKLCSFLTKTVNDESKELLFALQNKLASMSEKMPDLIKDYSFFLKSEYLDGKANGIKNLLRSLKLKENTRIILEEVQIKIIISVKELFYTKEEINDNDLKTLIVLLESLIIVNKFYSKEHITMLEKKNFRRTSFVFMIEFLEKFKEKIKKIFLSINSEAKEKINQKFFEEGFSNCFNVILKSFEDQIAFGYGQECFTLDFPPLSNKDLFYDDFIFYEKILECSFELFSFKFLRIFLERYFALLLYSSFHTFLTIIKKHVEKILTFTYENLFFFDAWNVFLDNLRSAAIFSTEVYSSILKKFVPKDFERNLNIRKYNEEYHDLLSCPVLLDNSNEKLHFYIKALKKVLAKDKHSPQQLEKIFILVPFYVNFQINFEILNCIFECIKPCYSEFITVPKFIYEKVTFLLDFLQTLHLKMPEKVIFIKIALNIPLSLNLVLQHFPKLSYFIAEGIQMNNELKTICYNILEKSLDSINTEILKIIPTEIFEKITTTLLKDSTEETFALAAMQILVKYHSSLKVFINYPHQILDSIYPRGLINLQFNFEEKPKNFNSDFLIKNAISNIRGEFLKETSSKVYSITSQLYSFRKTIGTVETDLLSKKIVIAFLYSTLGWGNFESELIYKKAAIDVTAILNNDYYIENNLTTQICSHQARVKKINYSTLLRHQQYVYDALIALYQTEEEDFLYLVSSVVISYKLIAFYLLAARKSKIYFNYKVLLSAYYEFFSKLAVNDYKMKECFNFNLSDEESLTVFYENEKYLFDKEIFNPAEELENLIKNFLPYKILKRNFKDLLDSGITIKQILDTNFLDDILNSITSLSFYKNEEKQKSFVLGVTALLVNLKEEKAWIYKNFSLIAASLLFCMSEPNPKYKNLIFLIFIFLLHSTEEFNIQKKESPGKEGEMKIESTTDMLNLQKTKTLPRKDIIEQLFNSLSSKHKKLRMIGLQTLIYYSELKKISLPKLLSSYCEDFYSNLKNKYSNSNSHMKLGFFDCLLLLNKIAPFMKNTTHLTQIANIVMHNQFVFYYDNILLLLRTRKFIIEEAKSEELINSNIDFIAKNISNSIFESEKIINICKEIISYSDNPLTLQKLFKKNFIFYFTDKANFKHFASTALTIIKIFPPFFTEELILMTIQHLNDFYDEASYLAFNLLYYLEKLPENIYNMILHFFSTMPCKVDDNLIRFLGKHTHFLDYMVFNCKETFVYLLLKNVILSIKNSEQNDHKLLYFNLHGLIKRNNLLNIIITEKIINFGLLASLFNYEFKKEELIHLFKHYNRNLFCYFYEFYEMNKEKLKEITLPNDFYFKDEERNKAMTYFEKKIYDENYLNGLLNKEDCTFDELCYLALYKPSYKIYKELIFYDESPTRIFEILRRIPLSDEINEVIIYTFENPIAYRIHLLLLMPLLIEFPNLINKQNLSRVLETIHRLFGTNSFHHKYTAGKLLYACSQTIVSKELLNPLYTQFFNFCIKCNDKEYFNLFKSIVLKLLDDFDFHDVDILQFAQCLDFLLSKKEEEKKKNLKKQKKSKKIDTSEKEIHLKLFKHLLPFLNDSLFFPSFLKFFTVDEINFFISQPKSFPKIAYHCILLSYKEKPIDQSSITNALETIIDLYKNPNNDLLFIDFQQLIQNYNYKKDIHFLRILGMLSDCCDDYYVYEQAILVLESFDETENKSTSESEDDFISLWKEIEFILRNYFFKRTQVSESFLNFLIYIFRNEKFKNFYEELKPFFVKGLESKFTFLRDEFHELLKDTLPRDKNERLSYLLGMDWNLFENNFTYTFLRLILDEELSFNLLPQYSSGNDHFYETIYKKKKENSTTLTMPTEYKEIHYITVFKNLSEMYKPENITKLILEFCFTNKETCVKILTGYLKNINITNLKEEFKMFALNLNINKFNSFVIDNFFSVFNYLLLDVRIRHNCYFSNIGLLKEEDKYLIYKLTEEYEYYLGSYNALFYSTNQTITELLIGNFEKSRMLIQKSFELISDENFNEKECLFLEDNWKYTMKNLCQWEALLEVAAQTNDIDLECDVNFIVKETGNMFLDAVLRKKDSFQKFVYECINNPFEQDTDSLTFFAQIELSQVPFYTPKFTKILNLAQILFEIKELQTLKKENLSDQRSLWSKREPLPNENMLNWIFFFAWRNKLFNFINKDENIIFLQELASLMNKITTLSRNMNYLEMAEFFNQLVYTTPNIRSSDAFTKIIEEIEILIRRNEHDLALRRAKTTNISYFSNEQRGIILYYIAKLERSNTNFNNATQVCATNSNNWNEWGMFLEETNGEIENICSSFIKATIYATKDNYKYFVKCIKYFSHEKMYEILKDNINNIDPSAYISYLSSFELMLIEKNNKCAELCLIKLGEVIPQTCFRRFRIHVTANESYNNNNCYVSKKETVQSNQSDLEKESNSQEKINSEEKKEKSRLDKIYQDIKFENNRSKLGLVMVLSLCSSRILMTHEQLAYSCLERIFYSCPNKYILKNIDLNNTFSRMFKCVKLTNWNAKLTKGFLDDFENYISDTEDYPSILLLKCYKWLNTIENILKTYISSHDLDLSTCRLIDNLLEYELVLFGKDEYKEKILIDHFLPTSTFYMSERIMSRTLVIVGSDGKEYLYLTQKNQKNQFVYEESILTLLNLLSLDLKSSLKCSQTNINYKSIVNFAANFDLLLFEEPFILLGVIYEESLKRTLRRIFIDYLLTLQEVSGNKIKGFESVEKYINSTEEDEILIEESVNKNEELTNKNKELTNKNEEIIKNDHKKTKQRKNNNSSGESEISLTNSIKESSGSNNLVVNNNNLMVNNNNYLMDYLKNTKTDENKREDANDDFFADAVFTNEHKLTAFKKISKTINDKLLFKGFTDLYGSSDRFFRFRKKFTTNYACLSIFNRLVKFLQITPSYTGIGLFSGTLKVIIFDLDHTNNNLFRLSPNIINLIGKEGLEGLFMSVSDNFAKFLLQNDFIKDYLESFTHLDYDEVKSKLEDIIDGKIKHLVEKSMNPEELCKGDISWYPWL